MPSCLASARPRGPVRPLVAPLLLSLLLLLGIGAQQASTASAGSKPTAPGGLTAVPGDASARLAWTASSDDVGVVSYRIAVDGVVVAKIPASNLTYTATGLTNGVSHKFVVRAIDTSGLLSPSSVAYATPVAASVLPAA